MGYPVENGIWRAVFAVPSDIVDIHLKLMGEVPLKVLLALLRHNGSLDIKGLSAMLGRSEAVIAEAVDYLLAEGIIGCSAEREPAPALRYEYVETPAPAEAKRAEAPVADAPAEVPEARKIATISSERRRFERDEINRLAESDEAVAFILQEAQQVLGKTLNAVATDTIVALYSYYGMKPDVVMMVLQYCKEIGKASMGYIEKVAATWIENGIETHEQAELEIKRQVERRGDEGRIKSAFGIEGRGLTAAEKKYIHVWMDEFGFGLPMVELAYERAVEMTGKLSFAYINGILVNWHTNGIKKPVDAIRETKGDFRKKSAAKPEKPSTSYDLGELEQFLEQGTTL